MRRLENEIFKMIIVHMETHNECVSEDKDLTEQEKEDLLFDVYEVKSNKVLKEACIEAMKEGLLRYALYSLDSIGLDRRLDREFDIFNDNVIDAYYNSI